MHTYSPARGTAFVWTVRFLVTGLLLTAVLAAFPQSVFLWGSAAVWCAALLLSVYAALFIRKLSCKLGPSLLGRSSGVFWQRKLWLRTKDVQATFCIQTPLMAVFGLYTIGLRLPGKTLWLDGLTRRDKEALPWR